MVGEEWNPDQNRIQTLHLNHLERTKMKVNSPSLSLKTFQNNNSEIDRKTWAALGSSLATISYFSWFISSAGQWRFGRSFN